MVSLQVLGVEEEWESLKYEHIDWNDIVEAEVSGNSDALSLLRFVHWPACWALVAIFLHLTFTFQEKI